jgi:hypothetical protein
LSLFEYVLPSWFWVWKCANVRHQRKKSTSSVVVRITRDLATLAHIEIDRQKNH